MAPPAHLEGCDVASLEVHLEVQGAGQIGTLLFSDAVVLALGFNGNVAATSGPGILSSAPLSK